MATSCFIDRLMFYSLISPDGSFCGMRNQLTLMHTEVQLRPAKDDWRSFVSVESRQGTCDVEEEDDEDEDEDEESSLMQRASDVRLLLMLVASLRRAPVTLLLSMRSLPARSTKRNWRFERRPASSSVRCTRSKQSE